MLNDVKSLPKGMHMKRNNYITVRDAARQLELTEYRVRQLIREKQLGPLRLSSGGLSQGIWRSLSGRGLISREGQIRKI